VSDERGAGIVAQRACGRKVAAMGGSTGKRGWLVRGR